MDRRTFIGAMGSGILVASIDPSAQTAPIVRRIGWLTGTGSDPPALLQEIDARFRELGWVEGRNLLIERRYANGRAELFQDVERVAGFVGERNARVQRIDAERHQPESRQLGRRPRVLGNAYQGAFA
jgi:hypothetical protein